MRFLLDECCDNRLAIALRQLGHDIRHASEIFPAASDEDVWDMAVRENRVLVTNDSDFGLLHRRRNPAPSAVILQRLDRLSPESRISRTTAVLTELADRLSGLIVIEPSIVRRSRQP